MGEKGRVEVHPKTLFAGPINPATEVLGRQFVPFDLPAAGLGIAGVKVESMRSGDERKGLFEIGSQLISGASLARIVPRHGQTTTDRFARRLEPADIVPLPAMQGDRYPGEPIHGGVGVDTQLGISFPRRLVGELNLMSRGRHRTPRPGLNIVVCVLIRAQFTP